MDIIKIVTKIIAPLKKDNIVENPELWKKLQSIMNIMIIIVPALIMFFPGLAGFLTIENLTTLAGVFGSLNLYFTCSTTEKVGI